jgi:hypothetical protein
MNRWQLVKTKEDGSKLYKSLTREGLYKAVYPSRSSTGCDCWERVLYTLKGHVDGFNQQVWVRRLDEVDTIPTLCAEHKAITAKLTN